MAGEEVLSRPRRAILLWDYAAIPGLSFSAPLAYRDATLASLRCQFCPISTVFWRQLCLGVVVSSLMFAPAARASALPVTELGRPFVQNFGLRDYHAHNQNWVAVQDRRGVLYFGNKNVVLEYDGTAWRKLHVTDTTFVRGLVFDKAGTLFVGAVGELGYFRAEPDGSRKFVSLLEKLPPEARDFRDIRAAHATADGAVFFVADSHIFRWRDGRFTVWKIDNPAGTPLLSHLGRGDQLIIQPASGGALQRLAGETFVPVAKAGSAAEAFFRENAITFLGPAEGGHDRQLLLGTAERGLFIFGLENADAAPTPWPAGADDFLRAHGIRSGLRLRDSTLALATADAGLILLDRDGRFLSRVDESAGLLHNTILGLFQDREGNLWLGLTSGISQVEVGSALSVFDPTNGGLPRTTIRDIARFRGELLLATSTSGVLRLLPADPKTARPAHFEPVEGLGRGEFRALCPHESGLLVGGAGGVFVWNGNRAQRVLATTAPVLSLRRSKATPDRVFVGQENGLRVLRFDPAASGHWPDEGAVPGLDADVRTMAETARGDLWLGTALHGAFRVRFPAAHGGPVASAVVTPFFKTHGLPQDQQWTRLVEWNGGDVLLATQAGYYRFDEPAGRFRRVPYFGARLAAGSFMLANSAQDRGGDLWLSGRVADGVWVDQEVGRVSAARGGQWQVLPYRIADRIGEIEKFYPDKDDATGSEVIWIGGTDGLARVDPSRLSAVGSPVKEFSTFIRQAQSLRAAGANPQPQPLPADGVKEPLPHARNSVRFEFAADTLTIGARVRFQTRLEGFEGGRPSDFSERASAEYTGLPEGDYVFHVRARDVDGRTGREATAAFRVLPPPQRTAWAYAGYVLLGAAAIFGLVAWRHRAFRRKNVQLETLVAARTGELRAREAELLRARDAADAANRAKSVFLANMSHELRTPLNAILGYTQILLKDTELSVRNRERLTTVGQSGSHLLAMINEVLDLSKIEAGKLTLTVSDFPLAPLLDDVCAATKGRAVEKGIEFHCENAPGLPRVVRSDPGKLRQVLFNLLGNAVKFTERGRVDFKTDPVADGRVRFTIADTGAGISAEELDKIFTAFHQGGTDARVAAQGTGLGLTISQRLVELLGGKLQFESAHGQGSRFWFELELPEVATSEEHAAQLTAAGATPRAPTGFRGRPRRLLIADDEETNRRVLRDLLGPLGFELEEVADGRECVARCAQAPRPDALLLDLRMPTLDGYAVAQALRASENGKDIRIIAISASVFEADRQGALDAGCDDFLPKPFEEAQLLKTLGRALTLEWMFAEPKPAAPVSAAAEKPAGAEPIMPPPATELDTLLELSRRGDIRGVKKQLAGLRKAENGRYAAFVRSLEPFVASYQMNRLRDALRKFQENGNGTSSHP